MRLPRFTARIGPPTETGLARATDIGALTRTGGQEFAALAQLGGAMQRTAGLGFQAYMQRQELDDIIESGIATQRVQESWNKVENEVDLFNPAHDIPLPDDPNFLKTLTTFSTDKRDKYLIDKLKDVEGDVTKIFGGIRNPKKKARLIKQYNENYATWVKNLKGKLDIKLNDYQLGEMKKLAEAAARNGNMEASDYYVDMMDELGIITHDTAISWKAAYYKISVEEEVIGLYSAGLYVAAREVLEASSLSKKEKVPLGRTINAAEKAQEALIEDAQKLRISQMTSKTIREYFAGEMTVTILNQRHESGLLENSEFKSMMKNLQDTIPDNSDRNAAGNIRRANVSFAMGAINRGEADKIVLENYSQLDRNDRENVISDLEDIEAKIIATAKSNAYSEGTGLMSRRFVGIRSEEDLLAYFKREGLTDEDRKRINRRFTAEVNNRDLYERAIDDRFKEMRRAKISDVDKYKAESLRILLQYQRRKRLDLIELETEISIEQRLIIATGAKRRPELTPISAVRPISEMTIEERQIELNRIRELKRLIK